LFVLALVKPTQLLLVHDGQDDFDDDDSDDYSDSSESDEEDLYVQEVDDVVFDETDNEDNDKIAENDVEKCLKINNRSRNKNKSKNKQAFKLNKQEKDKSKPESSEKCESVTKTEITNVKGKEEGISQLKPAIESECKRRYKFRSFHVKESVPAAHYFTDGEIGCVNASRIKRYFIGLLMLMLMLICLCV